MICKCFDNWKNILFLHKPNILFCAAYHIAGLLEKSRHIRVPLLQEPCDRAARFMGKQMKLEYLLMCNMKSIISYKFFHSTSLLNMYSTQCLEEVAGCGQYSVEKLVQNEYCLISLLLLRAQRKIGNFRQEKKQLFCRNRVLYRP